jgi:hypothetical protein
MLTETEFLGIAAITEYVFPPLRSPAGGMMPLFLQFSDAQGNLSVVYNTSVVIDLFPAVTDDVLTIEDGASVTPNRLVNLKIKIPANAYQMRVFEAGPDFDFNLGSNADGVIGEGNEGNSEATKIWVTAQNNFFYNFSSPGSKHLFLQFRDIDGSVSAAYSAVILVQPFLPISQGGFGFTINGGAPTTLVRNVTLSIAPPPNAVAFRFAQDRTPMPIDGWLTLVPNVPFTMFGRGLHAIFMQFIDANGDVSLNYSQSISVDLFGAFPGAFIINGGSTTTDNPVLALSIQPPVDASEMLITLNPDQIILNPALDCRSDQRGWMSVNSFATITVQSFGPKTVYVKFRNQTCDESGFIQRTVLYAP